MPKANNSPEGSPGAFANLKRLAYFAAVVEAGTFTAAAERLGVTKAVVSQQVARLEREFQTQLLTRTTRRVSPTDAGLAFYQRCALILREAGDAFDELLDVPTEPTGTLRLTAPFDYGLTTVVPAVVEFSRRHPRCKVDVTLSDQSLDLLAGEAELAIRAGWLTDLQLQARQIGSFRQLLVGTPTWARRLDRKLGPEQITALPFVANSVLKTPEHWEFTHRQGERRAVAVSSAIRLDATMAVRAAVCLGAGLSVLPDYAVATELEQGTLVHLLPHWSLPSGGIHVVYPTARFRPAKVRQFVEVLSEQHQHHAAAR
ncbi:MAG: LysR family transcriptional regulator [Rhizobacter sp.]